MIYGFCAENEGVLESVNFYLSTGLRVTMEILSIVFCKPEGAGDELHALPLLRSLDLRL